MTRILLAGDSWGIGVYSGTGDDYAPTGQGIQSILESHHFQVSNVSIPGCSNFNTVSKILQNKQTVNKIIFLQTDAFREGSRYVNQLKVLDNNLVENLFNYPTLNSYFDDYFNKLYNKLNNIGQQILCIGGWSQLHPCIKNYSNLVSVIPSATKLLISECTTDCYLSDFEWFPQLDSNQQLMQKFGNEIKQIALESSAKFNLCCQHWGDVHPNLLGYQQIVDITMPYINSKVIPD
jgi:hypothetical protein